MRAPAANRMRAHPWWGRQRARIPPHPFPPTPGGPMDAAVRAWLESQLGAPLDLADIEPRYTRLGTSRAVALEVLRGRLAGLRAQPSTVTVSGVVSVSYAETIKAYERQITALQAGDPPAPDDPAATPDAGDGFGVIQLVERPRR